MKKITVILMSLCLFYSKHLFSQENKRNDNFNYTDLKKTSIQESATFVKQNLLLLTIVPVILYFNKNIIEQMHEHPYISSLFLYLFINYTCDAILDYQEQEALIQLILLLKKITLHLVVSHGIKNHLDQNKQPLEVIIKEQYLFNTITKKWPYSFDKMTNIILESYQELKINLHRLNKSINIESEEFVFLHHASSITIEDLLYITQNDEKLQNMISIFEKNPELEIEELLEYLTLDITCNFLALEQSLLKYHITSIEKI